jgi:hypothetical protein
MASDSAWPVPIFGRQYHRLTGVLDVEEHIAVTVA